MLFIPCYFDDLPRESGSARIRCRWVVNHCPEAEMYDGTQRPQEFDLVVFQKAYRHPELRRLIVALSDTSTLTALDMCDPDWLDPRACQALLEVLPFFDFAVAPTAQLWLWLRQYLPAYIIPDRVDLDDLPQLPARVFDSGPQRVVWAGYAVYEPAVRAAWQLNRELETLALDRPLPFWQFWQAVLERDVLFNPRLSPYKSNNKTVIAKACGMPVAETAEEAERLLADPDARLAASLAGVEEVRRLWDVRFSVRDWKVVYEDCRSAA